MNFLSMKIKMSNAEKNTEKISQLFVTTSMDLGETELW